ncbi:MAG TPA: N-acetyltransferase [Lactobacillus sp.]|nr:N-acetyltransferase [Lactobacillus sp.]
MTEVKFEAVTSDRLYIIQQMYRLAFKPLYEKYQDADTSPYLETLEALEYKFKQPNSSYYIFKVNNQTIGMIRLITKPQTIKISPLLILPNFQGNGYAQLMLSKILQMFPTTTSWQVDTIEEEPKLMHLYRKCGFKQIPNRRTKLKDGMHIIYFTK